MSASILDLDSTNFDTTINQGITLVDFWADWCGPCKALLPTLETLAQEYSGKLKITKVNIDKNPNLPVRYGVRSIPALLLFKDGKQIDMLLGNQPNNLRDMLAKSLSASAN